MANTNNRHIRKYRQVVEQSFADRGSGYFLRGGDGHTMNIDRLTDFAKTAVMIYWI